MTYRRYHYNCDPGCKIRVAYTREGKKWQRIGQFYTKCGQFKLDKPSQSETKIVQEQKIIVESTHGILEPCRPQISDKELWYLCNSLRLG